MFQLTPYTRQRLYEQVPEVVASVLDALARERGLHLDGQRQQVIRDAAAWLMEGAAAEGLAADVAQAVLEQARNPHNGDILLDLLLLHRLNAGLEEGLPRHVAQSLVGLYRMTERRSRRRWRRW